MTKKVYIYLLTKQKNKAKRIYFEIHLCLALTHSLSRKSRPLPSRYRISVATSFSSVLLNSTFLTKYSIFFCISRCARRKSQNLLPTPLLLNAEIGATSSTCWSIWCETSKTSFSHSPTNRSFSKTACECSTNGGPPMFDSTRTKSPR